MVIVIANTQRIMGHIHGINYESQCNKIQQVSLFATICTVLVDRVSQKLSSQNAFTRITTEALIVIKLYDQCTLYILQKHVQLFMRCCDFLRFFYKNTRLHQVSRELSQTNSYSIYYVNNASFTKGDIRKTQKQHGDAIQGICYVEGNYYNQQIPGSCVLKSRYLKELRS